MKSPWTGSVKFGPLNFSATVGILNSEQQKAPIHISQVTDKDKPKKHPLFFKVVFNRKGRKP